jgi:hypothetical protein
VSDFLTRLARRSLGETPVIHPRLPGLFAPLNKEEAAGGAVAAFHTQYGSRPDGADSAPALPLFHGIADSITVDRIAASALPAVGLETNDRVRESDSPQKRGQAPARDEHVPGPARLFIEPSLASAPRSTGERPDASGSPSTSPLARERRQDRESAPAPPPLVTEREKPGARESRAHVASAIAHSLREPAQAPAVHITIGRVEVRANLAAPPPAPRERPRPEHKPALSLGDYLSRGRGKT